MSWRFQTLATARQTWKRGISFSQQNVALKSVVDGHGLRWIASACRGRLHDHRPLGRVRLGVGRVEGERLAKLGSKTVGDLRGLDVPALPEQFGQYGLRLPGLRAERPLDRRSQRGKNQALLQAVERDPDLVCNVNTILSWRQLMSVRLLRTVYLWFTLSAGALGLNNPVPFISNPLSPSSATPGSAELNLTINGTGFVSSSVAYWNGIPRATTFNSYRKVTAKILASDLAVARSALVTVVSPAPGGGTSNVAYFQVVTPRQGVSFRPRAQYTSGLGTFTEPFNIITADFNGDGVLDLAASNVGDNSVSVFLGNGDGTFQKQVVYAATFAISLASGDFNGDGNEDLAVLNFGGTNGGPGDILLMLGNSNGTFQSPIATPAGNGPYAIAVGDFNRDGKLDAVVADYKFGDNKISLLLGNGNGTFQPLVNYATSSSPSSLAVGDLNADGRLDVVVAENDLYHPAISVFMGKGDGTLQARKDTAFNGMAIWVTLGDVNKDGKLDLAIVDSFANFEDNVAVMLGRGDGTFGSSTSYFTALNSVNVAVAIADFNGDNRQDLAVNIDGGVVIFRGTPAGTFAPTKKVNTSGVQSIAVGDFNSDGRPDIAVVGWSSNSIYVWVQN
jgi:hypothetical protein